MRRRLWLLLFLAGIALGLGITSLVYDPVLDRMIPLPAENPSYVYLDQLNAIAPIIGKKVIFPSGLVDYASKEKLNISGLRFGPFRNSRENYIFTIRDYLDERRNIVGLKWKYDAAQDAIIFDFAWHLPTSQSGPELVDQMGKLSPLPLSSLQRTSEWKLDPWRQTLDELMSEPENFSHAWKARLEDCCCSLGSMNDSFILDNCYSRVLKDVDGKDHLLVLHSHSPISNKGPGWTFTYYLFAADGKWEDAGIFDTGNPESQPNVIFSADRAVIGDAGDAPYGYFLSINHGKVAAVLSRNGAIISPADYNGGMTPLRHLGD